MLLSRVMSEKILLETLKKQLIQEQKTALIQAAAEKSKEIDLRNEITKNKQIPNLYEKISNLLLISSRNNKRNK